MTVRDRAHRPLPIITPLGRLSRLDPRSRQSGLGSVQHGHISKQGSATAHHVLCEAAHAAMRSPGPLRAFGQRVRKRRNNKIATVAVARKLARLAWQLLTKQQDYIYERPALTHRRLRQLELAAGAPKRSNPRGSKDPATPDTPAQRATERQIAQRIEDDYRAMVADWKPQKPASAVT